ncbi:hypothetical protein LZ30DRAFT_724357 [Colletotrichum cereale]|nr:hypothetical protein LZ30DRAFT_724357 [Colletotrichum cereale]
MRLSGFLLLASSILVAGAPAATSTDAGPAGPEPTRDRYSAIKTASQPLTYEIGRAVEIKYRKPTTRKPILDIFDQTEKKEKDLRGSLASRIKAVSTDEAKVKIEDSPYAIVHNYELWEMTKAYASKEQNGKFKSYKVTPKNKKWWKEYEATYGFKVVSDVFHPRVITSIVVKKLDEIPSRTYEARFVLGDAK